MLVAHVNLMTTPTTERLAEKLAETIHDDLASTLFRARERLRVFSGLRITPIVTVDPTSGKLGFSFDATTWQWLKLFLGNVALAVVTLGLGLSFWGYRNWAFMVRHMHLYGEINVTDLVQSTTHAPGEAEGFADAFDIGAI